MKLNEEIFLMLLKNELLSSSSKKAVDVFYDTKGDKGVFNRQDLVYIANDIAKEFDKNSEEVILD